MKRNLGLSGPRIDFDTAANKFWHKYDIFAYDKKHPDAQFVMFCLLLPP
jgi:hypothetical protein